MLFLMGGISLFFLYTEDNQFFYQELNDENVSASYPAWENQSIVFDTVNETTDGNLILNTDNGSVGQFVSKPISSDENRSVDWQTFSYNADVDTSSINLTIQVSDRSDFMSIKDEEMIDVSKGSFIEDLSVVDAKFLRFSYVLEGDANNVPRVSSSEVFGVSSFDPNQSPDVFMSFVIIFVIGLLTLMMYYVVRYAMV